MVYFKKEAFVLIINREVFNPVGQTEVMDSKVFNYYIDICDQQKKGEKTDFGMIEEIRHIFFNSHPDISKSDLDRIWTYLEPALERSAGFAQFVLDFGGAESEFFFPWLIAVQTSPSAALEMAYGAGKGLDGKWHTDILETTDKINYFIHNVPTFVYNRERQLKVADLVMSVQKKYTPIRKTRVVDFGAGRMAWARHHGFKFGGHWCQEILAFDKDEAIHPEELFPDCPLDVLGLEYKHGDFITEMRNPKLANVDLAILGGVASYFSLDAFEELIVKPVYQMLKGGGSFFFDLQLDCPQYVWSVKLFNWPEIKLMKSPAKAIDTVENLRQRLWDTGMRMSADYALDTYNKAASSVMVTLTKL